LGFIILFYFFETGDISCQDWSPTDESNDLPPQPPK
jgi:hypothetical protein